MENTGGRRPRTGTSSGLNILCVRDRGSRGRKQRASATRTRTRANRSHSGVQEVVEADAEGTEAPMEKNAKEDECRGRRQSIESTSATNTSESSKSSGQRERFTGHGRVSECDGGRFARARCFSSATLWISLSEQKVKFILALAHKAMYLYLRVYILYTIYSYCTRRYLSIK